VEKTKKFPSLAENLIFAFYFEKGKKESHEKRYPSGQLPVSGIQGLLGGEGIFDALLRADQGHERVGRRQGVPVGQAGDFELFPSVLHRENEIRGYGRSDR